MIGNSQMLNEPVASIINLTGGESYTVGNGKALQFVSSGEVDGGQAYLRSDQYNTSINAANENQYGNPVFSNGTTITWLSNSYSTWVLYNLQSEPLPEKLEETTVSLNIPVSEVINVVGSDFFLQQANPIYVPNGKVLQLVGIASEYSADWANFRVLKNGIVYDGKIEVGFVFESESEVSLIDDGWYTSLFSFVMYDLNSQNLAYNVPNQTTPTLYPNPTSSLLALNSDKEYDIEVYDMAGNKVMALTGNTIDMSHLSSATYIVKALDKVENEEVSYKVVKN